MRDYFFSTGFFLLISAISQALMSNQPNVIVNLTDDQGWGDLSINVNSNIATPNIDTLARHGATFRDSYVCQVCASASTRAEFLTGRYYPRTRVSGVSRGQGPMNADETTMADLFKAVGYATGAFGKLHNGTQQPYTQTTAVLMSFMVSRQDTGAITSAHLSITTVSGFVETDTGSMTSRNMR